MGKNRYAFIVNPYSSETSVEARRSKSYRAFFMMFDAVKVFLGLTHW
jgi:hypothetical protein